MEGVNQIRPQQLINRKFFSSTYQSNTDDNGAKMLDSFGKGPEKLCSRLNTAVPSGGAVRPEAEFDTVDWLEYPPIPPPQIEKFE